MPILFDLLCIVIFSSVVNGREGTASNSDVYIYAWQQHGKSTSRSSFSSFDKTIWMPLCMNVTKCSVLQNEYVRRCKESLGITDAIGMLRAAFQRPCFRDTRWWVSFLQGTFILNFCTPYSRWCGSMWAMNVQTLRTSRSTAMTSMSYDTSSKTKCSQLKVRASFGI